MFETNSKTDKSNGNKKKRSFDKAVEEARQQNVIDFNEGRVGWDPDNQGGMRLSPHFIL